MSTHRVSVITFAGALALLLTAATTANAREYTREYSGDRTWSGKTSTERTTTHRRDSDTRTYTPKRPVVVHNDRDWRDDGDRGHHYGHRNGRYNRWHRFDRDGDFYRPRWQRRAWWHRYW
ncbi:MAG: hypothetical protein WBP38_11400 [Hyphomicrobium sp.]|nr:hypothetical protein [Hyphomicrobium sp.]